MTRTGKIVIVVLACVLLLAFLCCCCWGTILWPARSLQSEQYRYNWLAGQRGFNGFFLRLWQRFPRLFSGMRRMMPWNW